MAPSLGLKNCPTAIETATGGLPDTACGIEGLSLVTRLYSSENC